MSEAKGPKDYLELGTWNVLCDVCGFKFKAFELRKRWDGYMVCSKDFEERQPQDLIRLPRERQAPPWVRPQGTPASFNPITGLWEDGSDNFVVVKPVDPNQL